MQFNFQSNIILLDQKPIQIDQTLVGCLSQEIHIDYERSGKGWNLMLCIPVVVVGGTCGGITAWWEYCGVVTCGGALEVGVPLLDTKEVAVAVHRRKQQNEMKKKTNKMKVKSCEEALWSNYK